MAAERNLEQVLVSIISVCCENLVAKPPQAASLDKDKHPQRKASRKEILPPAPDRCSGVLCPKKLVISLDDDNTQQRDWVVSVPKSLFLNWLTFFHTHGHTLVLGGVFQS